MYVCMRVSVQLLRPAVTLHDQLRTNQVFSFPDGKLPSHITHLICIGLPLCINVFVVCGDPRKRWAFNVIGPYLPPGRQYLKT